MINAHEPHTLIEIYHLCYKRIGCTLLPLLHHHIWNSLFSADKHRGAELPPPDISALPSATINHHQPS